MDSVVGWTSWDNTFIDTKILLWSRVITELSRVMSLSVDLGRRVDDIARL